MIIKAPAKLNLSFNIFPKKNKAGLHFVEGLNCQLDLADEIEIQASEKITILSSHPQLENQRNTISQAINLLPIKKGIKIYLKKIIPLRCGLGGGSSDAAALLNYLNQKWQLKLSENELLKIGQKIGVDVVYCLVGGLCIVRGGGEKIEKLNLSLPKLFLVVINPTETKDSTAWAYQNLHKEKIGKNRDKMGKLIEALRKHDLDKIAENLHNDFEYSINKYFPVVEKIKNDLRKKGSLKAMLCGSGLSVFGLFANKDTASEAFNYLKSKYNSIFLTHTL